MSRMARLYVCRAKYHSEGFQIGKLVAGNCNFEWEQEIASADQVQPFYVSKKPVIGWFWMSSDGSLAPNYRDMSAEEGDLLDPGAEFVSDRVVACRARPLNSLGLGARFPGTLLRIKGQKTYECYGQNGASASGQSNFDVAIIPRGYMGDWAAKYHPTTGVYGFSVLAGDDELHALCLNRVRKLIGYTDRNYCYYGFQGKVLTEGEYDVFWCCRPGTPPTVVPRRKNESRS